MQTKPVGPSLKELPLDPFFTGNRKQMAQLGRSNTENENELSSKHVTPCSRASSLGDWLHINQAGVGQHHRRGHQTMRRKKKDKCDKDCWKWGGNQTCRNQCQKDYPGLPARYLVSLEVHFEIFFDLSPTGRGALCHSFSRSSGSIRGVPDVPGASIPEASQSRRPGGKFSIRT